MLQAQFMYNTILFQFEMKEQSYKNILTIPLKATLASLEIEVNTNARIKTYLGCQHDKDFIPFYESNSFY